METRDLEANAAKKLNGKHCDMLVANNLRTPGAGFATDTNVVTVLTPGETADRQTSNGGARWARTHLRNVFLSSSQPCVRTANGANRSIFESQ